MMPAIPMDVETAERAWRHEYQGTAHITLLENIQRSLKPGSPYSNSGPIIQSSGYGKSRTVDEMAKLIPTIPMNIRPTSAAAQGAFPPSDAALIRTFRVMESDHPVKRLFLFFKEVFDRIRDLAQGFEQKTFATSLYDHFKDQGRRAKFYDDLLEFMYQNAVHDRRCGSAKEAVASFEELAKLLPESKGPVKMVIYIDEAQELDSSNRSISGSSDMYDHVLAATTKLASAGVFFLLISSNSRYEVLASEPKLAGSHRFRAAPNGLVAPFTKMSFDCHPRLVKERIQPGLMLEEIQKFSFAVQFGRPLFWAYYEAMLNDGSISAQRAVLTMAQTKLIYSAGFSMPGSLGKLAILDTLLNLEFDPLPNHDADRLVSTLVASHLRTVYSVPSSREYMHTGYSSEPVLAEAALNLIDLYHWEGHLVSNWEKLGPLLYLYRTLDSTTGGTAGIIDEGEHGENVAKMILLLAYIAAVKNSIKQGFGPRFWGQGCSLVDFLTELTGENYCRDVLTSIPDNINDGLPLEKRFEKSWVRFTHFARTANDKSAMSSSVALGAFVRGMAMIGCRAHSPVHVNIPILLDKDKPITESNMSSILVQFKVCSPVQIKVPIDEEGIRYFPAPDSYCDASANGKFPEDKRTEYHTRPYISLVMELATHSSVGGSIRREVVHLLDSLGGGPAASKNKPTPQPPVPNVDASGSLVHPRYSLFYYGCSHKVFRCIKETEEEACRTLLRIPPVFKDRLPGIPIEPVLQMKPFWGVGNVSYSWLAEPYLNQEDWESKLPVPDDQVLVGNSMIINQDHEVVGESR